MSRHAVHVLPPSRYSLLLVVDALVVVERTSDELPSPSDVNARPTSSIPGFPDALALAKQIQMS